MTLPIPAGTYGIDTVHSQLGFSVSHLGISLVRGTFADFAGELSIGEHVGDTSVSVRADVASVSSGNAARDEVLQGPDWFAAADHPELSFVSTSVTDAGDGYRMVGDLTIRGITLPVTLLAAHNGAALFPMDQSTHYGFSARGQLSRSAFGVSFGVPLVSDEVDLHLEAQFIQPADA